MISFIFITFSITIYIYREREGMKYFLYIISDHNSSMIHKNIIF